MVGPTLRVAPIRERLLGAMARAALGSPRLTLAIGIALAVAAIATAPWLRVSASRFELIEPDDPSQRAAAAELEARLRSQSTLVVAVVGDPDDAHAAIDALAARLEGDDAIDYVLADIDVDALRAGELLLLPTDELGAIAAMAPQLHTAISDEGRPLAHLLAHARRALSEPSEATLDTLDADESTLEPESAALLTRTLRELDAWLTDPTRSELALAPTAWPFAVDPAGYFASADGTTRYAFVAIASRDDASEARATERTRSVAAELARAHDVAIGVGGYPALATDELRAIREGSVLTGAAAAALVMLLFAFAFRSPGAIVVAGAPLAIGVAWAFGAMVLLVGEVNLVTQAAAPVLAGLGIDFAIHLLASYRGRRRAGASHEDAVHHALTITGQGIVTGAVTSACAFAALALTEYDAFAQLGAIASIGLLLVLLAILLLCPALLTLAERSGGRWLRIEGDDAPSAALARLTDAVHDRPWLALGLAAIATIALALVARPIAFDADVEALMPREAESARVSRRLRADPSWSNESLAALAEDRDAVARLDAELRALPSVGRVESAALLLEDAELDTKLAILRDARERPDAPAGAPPGPIADELAGLASAAHEVAHDLSATAPSAAAPLRELAEAASRARADLSEADPRRVTAFEHALGERLAHLSLVLRETPRPLSIRDLPGQLRSRLVDGEGRYWVYAYPARDLFAPGELERFDDEVRSVAPDAVGYPLQLEAFLERTKQSAFHASGVALAVVLVLLWLDFRRVTDALLAILPVAVAVGWLYAILGALGVAANLANLAAVPIILGIGVDDGVHLVHRTRELGDPRAAQRSVGGALVLTTLTTIAGFGTIGLAAHRGMQGFALVMSLGSALALLATLVVLPAILALIHRRRSSV